MRHLYFPLLLAAAPATVLAQAPAITGTTLQTGTYQGRSLQATESVTLTDGFSVSAEGFEATIRPLGSWSPTQLWPFIAIHMHLMPSGRLMAWQGHNDDCFKIPRPATCDSSHVGTDVYYWSPGLAGMTVPGTTHDHVTWSNLFCGGHTLLADGKLFVAGGHRGGNAAANTVIGLNHANTYDYRIPFGTTRYNPSTGQNEPAAWARKTDMDRRTRWYPTTTTLPSGEVLVVGGETNMTGDGNMSDGVRHNDQPQIYNPATNTWRWLTGAGLPVPLYPMLFVAPNGQVFCAGPMPITQSRYLDPNGNGVWSAPFTNAAAQNNHYDGWREYGTPVLYERGKLLIVGGEDNGGPTSTRLVTNTAQMVDLPDLLGAAPTFRMAAPMQYPRVHANATVLPTGQVLVSGGAITGPGIPEYAALPAEIWTPPTATAPGGSWEVAAPLTTPRMYHATQVLLPDGRVLAAGGGHAYGATDFRSAQVYSPRYLEAGYRPVVTFAPATIGYGQPFTVFGSSGFNTSKVTLVRLGSVTHSLDMNQRLNSLAYNVAPTGESLTIVPPANANDAPPGHYLLFVVDANGVPSVGRVVQLTAPTCTPQVALSSTVNYSGSCTAQATVTVSGTNIGPNFRWFVDGAYQPAFDNLSQISVSLSRSRPMASVRVEDVSSTCGGGTSFATTSVNAIVPWFCLF